MATYGTTGSGISFSGLFSGIDSASIVTQLMALAQKPLTKLKTNQATVVSQQNAVSTLTSQMNALKASADGLRNSSALRLATATSSNTGVVTVATSAGAVEGTHSLLVNQLATAERKIKTTGFNATTTTVGAGVFSYTYNGKARSVVTTETSTVQNLVDLINNDSGNPGVTASLIYDGSKYYLSLAGNQTGATKSITINDEQTTLSAFDTADFTVIQAARNSQVRLDGWPSEGSGQWIERETNTISDLLAGVTFNLKSTGTSTIAMARDTSKLTNYINDFVAAYNNLVSSLSTYTGYSSSTQKGGVLQGDSISGLLNDVRQSLITTPKGFGSGDSFTLLGQIGLEFNKQGTLEFDSTVLDSAVAQDYAGVLALVGAQASGVSSNSYLSFQSASDTIGGGTYQVEVNYDESGNVATARIRATGAGTWEYFGVNGGNLTMTSGALAGLTLSSVSDGTVGAHTQSATLRLRQGFAGAVYDLAEGLLDDTSGMLTLKKERFETSYDSYTKRIEKEQARLDKEEARLKAMYARLEATLAKISGQTSGLQSLWSGDSSSSSSSNKSSS